MKVCLINPVDIPRMNTGLAYLLTSVKAAGHQVCLVDLAFSRAKRAETCLSSLRSFHPDIIGFSTITATHGTSIELARTIREEFPAMPMVWGGVHVTVLPEKCMAEPLLDLLFIGESEESMVRFLDGGLSGDMSRVPGIFYRVNGSVRSTPPMKFSEDLDSLPFPDWSFWDMERYFKTTPYHTGGLPVLASRGCPYRCSFCSAEAMSRAVPGRYFRLRSPGNVVQEIAKNRSLYQKKGFLMVDFIDDIFMPDKETFFKFSSLYRKEGLAGSLPWICATRADVVDRDWARLAKESGAIMVNLGLESGDERARFNIMNKKIPDTKFIQAAGNLREQGIECSVNIIIGAPGDTPSGISKSVRFADRLRPLFIHVTPYIPLPGTRLWEENRPHVRLKTVLGQTFAITRELSLLRLLYIYVRLKTRRAARLFMMGIIKEPLGFLARLVKYVLNIRGARPMPFFHITSQVNLSEFTVFPYYYRKWRASSKERAE